MSQKHTNIANGLSGVGIDLTTALDHAQLTEAIRIIEAGGGRISRAADPTNDTFVFADPAAATHTITIKAVTPGDSDLTLEVAVAADDNLAVTYTSGAIKISLANSTGSKNTLTLILAALQALNTSTNGAVLSAFITGTASTQMPHDGSLTVAATAAGGTAAGGIKSTTAGATGKLSYVPAA